MEEIDKTDFFFFFLYDEDLMMREVIQGDVDLYYLHHYLTELYRKG